MTDSSRPAPFRDNSYRTHFRETLVLALPVIGIRSGALVLQVTDTIMVGRHAVDELAYFGLGIAVGIPLMLIGLGFLLGVMIVTAQAAGAGNWQRCGLAWKAGMVHGGAVGLLALVLCQLGEPFFLTIGQDPDLSRGAGEVLSAFGWSLLAIMLFIPCTFFLEGIRRPMPVVVVMVLINVANVPLNYAMIYGNWGVAEMGALGAVWATNIVRLTSVVLCVGYLYTMRDRKTFGLTGSWRGVGRLGAKLRRLGLPLALSFGLETSAFMAASLMAGYLGKEPLAAYQVAINITALLFMTAIGLASATGVRVGYAVGQLDRAGRARAGWTGAMLAVAFGIVVSAVLGVRPAWLAAIYTTDRAVMEIATACLVIVALFYVFDSIQAVMINALRGSGETWVPLLLQTGAMWCLGVPLAAIFAFEVGWGAPGLVGGLYGGLAAAALLTTLRFRIIARREPRPL